MRSNPTAGSDSGTNKKAHRFAPMGLFIVRWAFSSFDGPLQSFDGPFPLSLSLVFDGQIRIRRLFSMEEGDDDLNPLISPGIVLLGIFRSGLVIFIAAISLVIVLHRFRHILAGLVRQILQIIELGGKVEFREGSEGIVQIVQIGEQFGGWSCLSRKSWYRSCRCFFGNGSARNPRRRLSV